jgi:DNA-directed RNA polymerase subunit K/omega
MSPADALAGPVPVTNASSAGFHDNRFLLVVVAFQRAAQLRGGARPHLEARGHKSCTMAIAEVMAGTVAYSVV